MDDYGGPDKKKENRNYFKWCKYLPIPTALAMMISWFIYSGISPQELVELISSTPFIILFVCFTIVCICVGEVAVKLHHDKTLIQINQDNRDKDKERIEELLEKNKKQDEESKQDRETIKKLTDENNELRFQIKDQKRKMKLMKTQIQDLQNKNSKGEKQGSDHKIIKLN